MRIKVKRDVVGCDLPADDPRKNQTYENGCPLKVQGTPKWRFCLKQHPISTCFSGNVEKIRSGILKSNRTLVGGLVAIFYFPINIGFLIPIDELIFFRGVNQPPTRTNFY